MSAIYFLVSGSKNFRDPLNAMKTYFEGGGFSTALIVAFAVAAVIAAIYYIMCRTSFSWAKMSTWWITLVVTGVVSFAVTGYTTGIYSKKGALPQTVEKQWKKKIQPLSPTQVEALQPEKAAIERNIKKGMFGCNPVNMLCITNFVYSMLLFYFFSLCFNGFSVNGVNIPHRGFFKF